MFQANNKARLMGVAALSILAAGCEVDVKSDIYSRDVFASENLTFPTQMRVEVPSCSKEKVNESAPQILAVFSDVSEASVAGCERDGMDSMLVVNFTGEMVDSESGYDFAIFRNKQPEFTYLTAAFNSNFQTRVEQLMSNQYSSLEPEGLTISFTLNNDLPGEVSYIVLSGWVDGEPGHRIQGSLDRREKIHVRLPKVVSHLILKNAQPDLITLMKKEG